MAAGESNSRSRSNSRLGPGRWIGVVVLAVTALAAAEHFLMPALRQVGVPTGEAAWIWAEPAGDERLLDAFYAVRQIELPAIAGSVRAMIAGDEEYVLFINGRLVGLGGYRAAAPIDSWEVGSLLQAGANRIVVELRTHRGVGGLLFRLQAADEGAPDLVSDGEWWIVRRYEPGMLSRRGPLPAGEPARVWSRPPAGRWGVNRILDERPLGVHGTAALAASLFLVGEHGREWLPVVRNRGPRSLGTWVSFDWGREVTGQLHLTFADRSGAQGLIAYDGTPRGPRTGAGDELFFSVAGRDSWGSTRGRNFRYVTVVANREIAAAQVFPAAAEETPERRGVFGLEPARLRTPAEDKFWRDLESVPSVAGGKGS